MAARETFNGQFVVVMERILQLYNEGYKREQIIPIVGLSKSRISRAIRIYLTSLGKTPDASRIEVKNKAIELVKLLEADEISLTKAEDELVATIKANGSSPINRSFITGYNPELQLQGYLRAVANLEGICYGLDKMPEVVHSSITFKQRKEIETRLAECRRIIERRINIFRRDNNAEASNQEG